MKIYVKTPLAKGTGLCLYKYAGAWVDDEYICALEEIEISEDKFKQLKKEKGL